MEFERLGDILHGQPAPESSSPTKAGGPQTRVEPRVCGGCGREFDDEFPVYTMLGREYGFGHRLCAACETARQAVEGQQAEEARATWLLDLRAGFRGRARMPRGLWEKTFASWTGRSTAFTEAMRFAEDFPLGDAFEYPSLFLFSRANGLGKSHLAAACANLIFDRWLAALSTDGMDTGGYVRCPVLYHTGPDLILRVRSTYNVRPDEAPWRETEAELYDTLKTVPLLILDDLGKEAEARASDHTQRVYFQVIDGRYLNQLPVLVCSNMGFDELEAFLGPKVGPAVKDRLIEMTHDRVIELRGKSHRKRMWANGEDKPN